MPSPATFEDRSPLDWSWKLADVARGDANTAHAAVTAAVMAFRDWADLGPPGRAEHLHRLADLIDAHNDEIAIVETVDMGMLHESMRARLVARGAVNFRTYADLAASYEERQWSSKGTRNTVVRMPAGPAVIITPWNAPFMLSTWKVAPALAAGNTVILKPAEWSPLSCSLLADLTVEAGFPPGVFNLVQGIGEEVGPPLVGDPRVKRISFTGSPETARHIGRAAAENIVPFTAELGGKGPLIVFADADLDAAAAKAAGQYDDSGQVCLAGTRLLVEASVRDEFLEPLPRRRRPPRARRQPRPGDDDRPDDPPRPRGPGRGVHRAGPPARRPRRARRAPGRRLAARRADADRAGVERQRDRPAARSSGRC